MKVELYKGKLWAHPLFFPLFLWMCIGAGKEGTLAFTVGLLIHEAAHLAVARAFGMETQGLVLYPFGCAAELPGMAYCSSLTELMVAAAGPAANLVASAILLQTDAVQNPFFSKLCQAQLGMAAVNLLPALPLDGGRIFCAAAAMAMGERRAVRISAVAGLLTAVSLLAAGIYTFWQRQGNISLLCMGVFLLIGAAGSLRRAPEAAAQLQRAHFLGRTAPAPVRIFALGQEKRIGTALTQLHRRAYNMVCVLDEEGRVVTVLDEAALRQSAIRCGVAAPLGEVCKKPLYRAVDRKQ